MNIAVRGGVLGMGQNTGKMDTHFAYFFRESSQLWLKKSTIKSDNAKKFP